MRSSLIISRRAHIPSILRLLYSEKRPVLTPLSSLARRVLICCIHFTPYTLSADISHANLFSAIAFTSMHAVCFFFLHSKEIFFLQNVAFFVYNFHFHYNGLCVAVGSRARSYRTRNASHRIASSLYRWEARSWITVIFRGGAVAFLFWYAYLEIFAPCIVRACYEK